MPGITNNLYPPILSAYMPAFVRTTTCRIYFSLSIYNNIKDIKNVQIIISDQNTNISALDGKLYPAGIKITSINIDEDITNDEKYYVTISSEDLEEKIFGINQYYKVQIRFTGQEAEDPLDSKKIASWLVNNQGYFSEWSTVCLIKGIEQPQIYLRGFENDSNDISETVFTKAVTDFVGSLYYNENEDLEKETLKYFKISIYNNASDILVYNTGNIYTNEYNPNEINYTLKYTLEDGINYRLILDYYTINEYHDKKEYIFAIIQNGIDKLDATITASPDTENGRIIVNILSSSSAPFLGNLAIRRSSNKSNFTIWEDVKIISISDNQKLDLTWYDYTAESGVWYKYCAQKINNRGDRGIIISIKNPIMLMLDDIFLTNKDMQLKVKFNPIISNFKHTVLESKTETLGSKYPYIRRNGQINYKQFPLSGLITSYCDEDKIFITDNIIYGDYQSDYIKYNEENDIDPHYDHIYEREFREKVIDFLYDNSIKLFRSTEEGNILIKLMDISFTPETALGRMIYSFSGTAYEIDECSIDNYNKYNISTIGVYNPYIEYVYSKIGQISDTVNAFQEILDIIQEKIDRNTNSGYINTIEYIESLRINFESKPYLIKVGTDGTLEPVIDGDILETNIILGYIVYINNEPILVSRRSYYELTDKGTVITSIKFPINTQVSIDYKVKIHQTEDISHIASKYYYHTKAGQIYGVFNPQESVYKQIYLKYYEDYKSYYQRLIGINKINIEADPGTVIYIKDSFDDIPYRHVIGDTSQLLFDSPDVSIENFYFYGVHFVPAKYEVARKNEYIDTQISINNINEIENLIINGVYNINGKKQIYYNNNWYDINDNYDIMYPVEALVDYIFEVVKGEY